MAWVESHQELWRHPKTKKLARLLGVSVPTAVGHLHGLWYWALDFADDGAVSQFDAEEIADAVMWDGEPQQLVEALEKSHELLRAHRHEPFQAHWGLGGRDHSDQARRTGQKVAQFPKEGRERTMMTQTELRAYYRDRAALRLTEETLAGLREYAAASDDDLERDIAALEETAREQAEALTARSAEVLATLETIDDICRRTELLLHFYRGMEWKEVAAILGASCQTVRNRCSRALRAIVPE